MQTGSPGVSSVTLHVCTKIVNFIVNQVLSVFELWEVVISIFPSRIAQSVGHLTLNQSSWVRYLVWPHTFVSPSADSRGAVASYWQKYVHEVLVNCLGDPSLPWKSVVRLTDRPDMTLDVYRGCKTTTQQQQQSYQSPHKWP